MAANDGWYGVGDCHVLKAGKTLALCPLRCAFSRARGGAERRRRGGIRAERLAGPAVVLFA